MQHTPRDHIYIICQVPTIETTDLHIYNLDAVPPIHIISNHVDKSLPLQMVKRLRRVQPVAVANHVKACHSPIERAVT